MALTATFQSIRNESAGILALLTMLASFARDRWGKPAAAKLPGSGGPVHRAAQAGTVVAVVVIGVVALIGLLIFDQVYEAIPDNAIEANSALDNSTSSVVEGFGSSMELVPIVLLVLIAALVIAVVQRMRGNGGM